MTNRTTESSITPIACAAYHEAGHAVATVLAFYTAKHPNPLPPQPVKYIELNEEEPGCWGGICWGPQIYAPEWPEARIHDHYREAMEWQIVINQAGGVAEAIYRGERRKKHVMPFTMFNCGVDGDLKQTADILVDLRMLTKRQYGEQRFTEQALKLMLDNWSAVEALAAILIADKTIHDGERIKRIVFDTLPHSSSKISDGGSIT